MMGNVHYCQQAVKLADCRIFTVLYQALHTEFFKSIRSRLSSFKKLICGYKIAAQKNTFITTNS